MRNRNLLICIILAVTVGACGGEATDDEAADTSTSAADTASTNAETTTTAVATTSATTDDSGTDSDDGDGVSGVCIDATQAMAAAMSSYSTGMTDAMSGNLDSESLELAAGQLEAMAEAAPDEIRDDMRVIAAELGKFYAALAEIDYEAGAVPTPEQSEQLAALGDSIDQQAFDEAAAAVELWFEENC